MIELLIYQKSASTLQEVMQLPLEIGTIGLFYTPQQCQFVRYDNGEIRDANGNLFKLEQVFEARLFHSNAELRWLRDPNTNGLGRAVYLFENTKNMFSFDEPDWQLHTLSNLTVHKNHYLLWGKQWQYNDKNSQNQRLDQGWSLLANAQIGKLPVPVPNLQKNQRIRLKTREYFGLPHDANGKPTLAAQHGNQVVVEERWLSLEAYNISSKEQHV